MPTLAPKLPYTHPFAGGYPRLGGQPLPTDPDAIDYLNRVAAADGAAVEVGVAMAVDAFVRGCKADSAGYAGDPTRTVWDALQACCIMCGARTISGALVPLKTPYGPELVNIDALQTPSVTTSPSVGLTVAWDGETRTLSVTSPGTTSDRPAAVFPVGMVSGKRYRIEGRLSGDTARAFNVGTGSGQWAAYNTSTGEFSGVLRASGTYFWLYVDGRQASSVRIESLSIREDSFTPTAYPQPVNFVSADYDRSSGLKGDGIGKYLDSNRASNADGQDDVHISRYATAAGTRPTYEVHIGMRGSPVRATTQIGYQAIDDFNFFPARNETTPASVYGPQYTGFAAAARSSSDESISRINGSTQSTPSTSEAPPSVPYYVFARNSNGSIDGYSDARLAFYSIGSAIPDLAALDNRVTQLVTGIKFHSLTGLVATDYDPDTVAYIVAAYEAGGTL